MSVLAQSITFCDHQLLGMRNNLLPWFHCIWESDQFWVIMNWFFVSVPEPCVWHVVKHISELVGAQAPSSNITQITDNLWLEGTPVPPSTLLPDPICPITRLPPAPTQRNGPSSHFPSSSLTLYLIPLPIPFSSPPLSHQLPQVNPPLFHNTLSLGLVFFLSPPWLPLWV